MKYVPKQGELTDAGLEEMAAFLAPMLSLRAAALLAEMRGRRQAIARARALMTAYRDGDEPEGAPSASRTLRAIAELLEL